MGALSACMCNWFALEQSVQSGASGSIWSNLEHLEQSGASGSTKKEKSRTS